MTVNKFIKKLLNLKGLFVTSYHFKIRDRVLDLWVKPYKNGCLCPYCNRRGRIVRTMYEPRQWRNIPICGWSVFFMYCPREILCPTHSRVQEDIPWAKFRRTKGTIKLHLLLDHDEYLPTYAYISNGKRHDVTIARKAPLSPGSIVAMDRGYNDYKLFVSWTVNGIFFVTRLKENADYMVVEHRTLPKNRNILADQLIRFTGYNAKKNCPHILRRVVVWDKVKEREIVLLTNHLAFGPTNISSSYKD